MKQHGRLLLLGALLSAAPALAQVNYSVITRTTQPYVPLSTATNVTSQLAATGSFQAADEGSVIIPLGFSFPFYGNTYTSVVANSNGVLVFNDPGVTSCVSSNCHANHAVPGTGTPNNLIGAWWDDMFVGGQIRHYSPNPSEIIIEYHQLADCCSATPHVSFQVRLTSSGMFQVHYGPKNGTLDGEATAGFENANGTLGGSFLTCGPNCDDPDWPANALFTVGETPIADIFVEQVNLSNMVKNGSNLTFTVAPTFQNFGLTPANNFHWRAWLSTDRVLDSNDQLVFTSTSVLSMAARGTVTASGNASASNVAAGQYYILVEADPAPAGCTTNCGAVHEFSETNNVGSTTDYFTFGIDLVARSISGPANTGPGNTVQLAVNWYNQGTDPAPTPNNQVEYEILLSLDRVFDSNDHRFPIRTETVTGGATFNTTYSITVPDTVRSGEFHWGIRVDPRNQVTETDENNNVAFSSGVVSVRQADLVAMKADLTDRHTFIPTRRLFIGEKGRMTVTLNNTGGADARNFETCAVISEDANMSLNSDAELGCTVTANVPAGGSVDIAFEFPVPPVAPGPGGKPFKTGNYYLFAVADRAANVAELAENNNVQHVGGDSPEPILLLEPASDYVVGRVDAPASAAVGEALPVYRILRNIGNKAGGTVSYRFYASANDIIDIGDTALPIIGDNGQILDSREITLGAGESDAATEFVRLPGSLVAGSWYIGVLVDQAEQEAELDERNNGGASSGTVTVAPSSMWITQQQLPDAVIGQAYNFKLGVAGAQGPVTWTADANLKAETGLELSPDGIISGIPTATTMSTFSVTAESAGRTAMARLVLRVLAISGELTITSLSLPPVVNSSSFTYSANLSAAGGTHPYQWRVIGQLPPGIQVGSNPEKDDGVFHGQAQSGIRTGAYEITVEVTDAVGTRVTSPMTMKVIDTGALYISSLKLPETAVGLDYFVDLAAKMAGDPAPALDMPLTWSVAGGTLPDGITLTTENSVGVLAGKALVSGSYIVSIQVVDAKNRSDVANLLLRVHSERLKLTAINQPAVIHPGQAVDFQISTGNDASQYRIFSGTLPPGLSMDHQGHISGTVEMDNSVGTWNYVVEAKDAVSGSSLGAFSLEVAPSPVASGCSAAQSNGTGAMWLTLFAPLLAFFGRRRKLAVGLATAAVAVGLVAPASAQAQTQAVQYQVIGPVSAPYTPISGSSLTTSSGTGASVSLPFEFTFYDHVYPARTNIGVSQHGYITFESALTGQSSNAGIPHSSSGSTPTVFAAPWWDSLVKNGTGSLIRHQTTGAAPNRVFTVEWANVCTTSSCALTSRFSFQVQLHEGSNKIRFAYGAAGGASPSASVGIMNGSGVGLTPMSNCTSSTAGNCGVTHFPQNKYIDFALPADLQVAGFNSDDTVYAGVPTPVSALIANKGGLDAQQVKVAFYLSDNPTFETTDPVVGTIVGMTVPLNSEKLGTGAITVPSNKAAGNYFLLAKVDPEPGTVFEGPYESNNLGTPMAIKVGPPTPNLVANTASTTATTVAAGGTITLNKNISNSGNADMTGPVQVTYFLSDNSVVTTDDTVLKSETLAALAKNASNTEPIEVTLPSNVRAGKYWVGYCVDYDPAATPPTALQEISEVDNCVTGKAGFAVDTGELTIVTTSLGSAVQHGAFGLPLEVTGGDGTYAWSIESGALPKGLTLAPNGYLSGTPSEAGSFSFTVKVASAGTSANKAFSLEVSPYKLALTIVDQDLSAAEFGRSYKQALYAVGGQPPYSWSVKAESRLPEGLGLSREGTIEGRAAEVRAIPFGFSVEVKDRAGAVAAAELAIRVVAPTSLSIAVPRLATAYVGESYRQR